MRKELNKLFSPLIVRVSVVLIILLMVAYPVSRLIMHEREYSKILDAENKALEDMNRKGYDYSAVEDELLELTSNLLYYLNKPDKYEPVYGQDYWSEMLGMNALKDYAEYAYESFPKTRVQLVKASVYRYIKAEQKYGRNSYSYRINKISANKYNREIPLKLISDGTFSDEMYSFFNFNLFSIILIVAVSLFAVRMFSVDYKSGAYRIIDTGKNNMKRLFFNQFFAVWVVGAALLFISMVIELIICCSVLGLRHFNIMIQHFEMYERCPYLISVWGYYLIKFLINVLVYTFVIAVVACITRCFKKIVPSILASVVFSGGLLAGAMELTRIVRGDKPPFILVRLYDTLKCVIPHFALDIYGYIGTMEYVNILGFPISRLVVCIVVMVTLSALFLHLGYRLTGRNKEKRHVAKI